MNQNNAWDLLQSNLKERADRIDRAERNRTGHESIIVEARRCVHGASLYCFLFFCLYLKFSVIQSFFRKDFLQDFQLVTAHLENTWNVKHCLRHFTCLLNTYRNPSEINAVIHPILYVRNWRHRKLNNLPMAVCLVTGRAETGCGLISSAVGSLAAGSGCFSHSVKKHCLLFGPNT